MSIRKIHYAIFLVLYIFFTHVWSAPARATRIDGSYDLKNPNCEGLEPNGKRPENYWQDHRWIPWDSKAVQAAWDSAKFTDPQQYEREHFRFIVHGLFVFSHSHSVEETFRYVTSATDGIEKVRISASVINQNERTTAADVGFILRVPSADIVAASNGDMNTGYENDNRRAACYFGLPTPDEIWAKMPESRKNGYDWNEVLLQGTAGNPVSVSGIFIVDRNRDDSYGSWDFDTYKKYVIEIKQLAKKENLPIVHLRPMTIHPYIPPPPRGPEAAPGVESLPSIDGKKEPDTSVAPAQ